MNLKQARIFCTKAHGSQGYGSTSVDDGGMDGFHPYSYHLRQVEQFAIAFGFGNDFSIRKAAWGHDVLEDTKTTKPDLLRAGFSLYEVALIDAVTDGIAPTRHERKLEAYRKINLTPNAVIVKLCDRIANVSHALKAGEDRKYNLYVEEQTLFEASLKNCLADDVRVKAMWRYLHFLFSDKAKAKYHRTAHCCANAKRPCQKAV